MAKIEKPGLTDEKSKELEELERNRTVLDKKYAGFKSPSHAQNRDEEIIEQIKKNGPGTRFAIKQIQPIKGHDWNGFQPITFTGSTISGDFIWVVGGITAGGNNTVIRFTGKISFLEDTFYLGKNKVYLPQNIKGITFDSQADNPLTFILLEKYGFVYVSGRGSVVSPDGKFVELPEKDLTSLESSQAATDNSKVTVSENEAFYITPKELQVLTKALKGKEQFFSAFVVDKIPEGGRFDSSDLNRMSQFVKGSNDITKVTIKDGKVQLEFPGDKMILSQRDLSIDIWHIGATIRFDGEFKLEEYSFIGEGDQLNRLTFKIDESGNFKYLSGKGRVIIKEGKEVKLGY